MPKLNRRRALLGLGASAMAGHIAPSAAAAWNWQSAAPADVGLASGMDARLDKLIGDKRVWGLHAVLVARSGRLLLERYFEGEDDLHGRPLGKVAFNRDTLHDVRSVSKSIVGLLYGIALQQGKVPPPEAPLLASFPEYSHLAGDPVRSKWIIQHALTMTLGTNWDEVSVPYSNPANSEIAMDRAPDRYRFVLDAPVNTEPGKTWTYNGGTTALLGRIIATGTGKPLQAFAREVLFDPLGIGRTEWVVDRKGEAYAASGLRMTPRDLARIGVMMVGRGAWEGRSIVPAEWIEKSTRPFVSCPWADSYGYQWYVGALPVAIPGGVRWEPWWGAFGNGGQRLFIVPNHDLIAVITGGNYNNADQGKPATRIMQEVVLPSIG